MQSKAGNLAATRRKKFSLTGVFSRWGTTANDYGNQRICSHFRSHSASFRADFGHFTHEKRRGRESNPRIAVLQTATLPLGYPAVLASEIAFSPMKTTALSIDSL
jgi:hypothetical protein